MPPFADFSRSIRRATKQRQRRLTRKKPHRPLLSETLEDRRLLTAQPVDAFARERPPALDIAVLTRGKSTAQQKAAESIFGTHTDAKNGELRKVGTQLAFLYHEFAEHNEREKNDKKFPGPLQEFRPSDRLLKIHDEVDNEKVIVDIVAYGDPAALEKDLVRLGMEVTGVYRQTVSGLLPIEKLGDVASDNSVRAVNPFIFQTASGAVDTQGDQAQLSDDLRANQGLDGSGITVGLLSDSYDNKNGAAGDILAGELPGTANQSGYTSPINVLSDMASDGSDEGRAMFQVIHDIAPGAQLAFATATLGQAAFAQSINDLHEIAGANVIVDDVLYFAEPFFQDGVIAQAVDNAYAEGVAYFTAAGNNTDHSYESSFVAADTYDPNEITSEQGAPPFAGGQSHDFDPDPNVTDDKQGFRLVDGQSVTISFQWDEPFASVSGGGGSAVDMDIYILNSDSKVVAASLDSNIGADAVEILQYTHSGAPADYSLMLVHYGGTTPQQLKYIEFSNGSSGMTDLEYPTNSSTIFGHSNAAGAATVGATYWFDTPEFNSPTPGVQSFSSVGGTDIYFDPNGSRYGSPIPRDKPDFTAPDGGNTTFHVNDVPEDADNHPNFLGTSASAAHAAGLAALLLEGSAGATPQQLYDSLRDTATDIPLSSTVAGQGLVHAENALPVLISASDGAEPFLDATTFSAEGFDETIVTSSRKLNLHGDDFIPVDTSEVYRLSGEAKSSDTLYTSSNSQYFGFASFDDQFREIQAHNVRLYSGAAETELAQDLNDNDDYIYLDDVSGWADSGSGSYQRNFAWYPVGDSNPYVYTPHAKYNYYGLWDVGAIDTTMKRIELKNPWDGGFIAADTKVGNAEGGADFNYAVLGGTSVTNSGWTTFENTITGVSATSSTKFRPGTAYIKPAFHTNNHGSGTNEITWRQVTFERDTGDRFQVGDTDVDLRVNASKYDPSGNYTYQWTQISGPQVTISGANTSTATIAELKDSLVDYSFGFEVAITDATGTAREAAFVNVEAGSTTIAPIEPFLDATTFSAEGFDETIVTSSRKLNLHGDDFIPVDTNEVYKLSGEAKSSDTLYTSSNSQYFGFASFDDQFREIQAHNVRLYSGAAETELAQDLNDNDDYIYLDDVSGWADTGSGSYQRNFAWYPVGDSNPYVYTPHAKYNYYGLWDVGAIDTIMKRIELKNPWDGGFIAADTKVGNAEGGADFNYAVLGGISVTNSDWTTFENTITGVSATSSTKFRPGTAYIKPAFHTNNHGSGTNEITWKNVKVEHDSLTEYRVGDTVDLQLDPVQFPGGNVTYHWTQTSGPPVPLSGDNTATAAIAQLPNRLLDHTVTFEVDIFDGISTLTEEVSINVDVNADYEGDLGAIQVSPAGPFSYNDNVTLQVNELVNYEGSLTYQWEQLIGPTVTLSGDDTHQASFTVPDIATDELVFQLTVSDGALEIVKEVVIDVDGATPDVTFTLKTKDKLGNEVSTVAVGDDFFLEVYVEDTRGTPKGAFSAYLDVLFDQELASVKVAPDFSDNYDWATDWDISTPGLINEAGGATGTTQLIGGTEELVFSTQMVADAEGTVTFRADPSDDLPTHEVTVYGSDAPVSANDISYGSTTLTLADPSTPYATSGVCGVLNVSPPSQQLNEPSGQGTITISSTSACTALVEVVHTGSDGYTITGITESEYDNLHIDSTQKTLTIDAENDLDDSDETISVQIVPKGAGHFQSGSSTGLYAESAIATVDIDDDDSGTGCHLEIANSAAGTRRIEEGGPHNIALSNTGTCTGNLELSWSTSQNGADYGPDWELFEYSSSTPLSNSHSIAASSLPHSLELRSYSDNDEEVESTITFTLSPGAQTANHTITVHDSCSYTITPAATTVNEGHAQPYADTEITITADGDSFVCGSVVDLSWSDNGGSGAESDDFEVLTSGAGVIPSGTGVQLQEVNSTQWTATVTLRVFADSDAESDTSTVTFSADGADPKTVTIQDDDGSAGSLEVVTSVANAHEKDTQFYCGAAVEGAVLIQSVSSWPTSSAVPELVLKPTGSAIYEVDYIVYSLSHTLVQDPDGYIRVVNSGTGPVTLKVQPMIDSDETEGTETIQFELLNSAANSTLATVNLIDDPEGVDIIAVDDTATEEGAGTAQVKLAPEHTGELLCTELRLIIDSNPADSADPPDTTTDYTLKEGATVLEANPYLQAGVFRVADGPVSFDAQNESEILIDLIPVDDGKLEGTERVYANVEARRAGTTWELSSNPVILTIEDNTLDAISPAEIYIDLEPDNECIVCTTGGIDVDLQSGAPTVPIIPGFLDFRGQGTHGTQPVVRGQFEKPTDGTWPDEIEVKVKVDDWDDNNGDEISSLPAPLTFTLDTTGYQEDSIAFAVPLDVDGLATGSYRFELIGDEVGAGTDHWDVQTSHFVINRWATNDVAPGLSFPFLKQVLPNVKVLVKGAAAPEEQTGVAIVRGDNSVSFYKDDGSGGYDTPAESVSELSSDANYYILTDRFGNVDRFRKTAQGNYQVGSHYDHQDSNGNVTLFTYGTGGELDSVTNPLERTTDLVYTTVGNVEKLTITDFAGRDTTVEYDTITRDLDVVYPSPSSGPQPQDTFEFDAQHRLTKITRHAGSKGSENQVTVFKYEDDVAYGYADPWGRLTGIKLPDEETWELEKYRQGEALPPASKQWTGTLPKLEMDFANEAEVLDQKGVASTSVLDHRGRVISFTDRHGQTFTYERKLTHDIHGNYDSDKGEVLTSTTPDPDDFGNRPDVPELQSVNEALGPQVTQFTYDNDLNITQQILPDLGISKEFKRLWSDFHLGRPQKFTNELNQIANNPVDTAGNVTENEGVAPVAAPSRTQQGLQNPLANLDVNGDGTEDQTDLDKIVDEVDDKGIGDPSPDRDPDAGHTDTTGDGVIAARDALLVVNDINNEPGSGSTANQSYDAPVDEKIVFTYTDASDGVPIGLVKSKEVTTGRTSSLKTTYEYYDTTDEKYGLLKKVNFAVGTTEAEHVDYFYDSNGNLEKYVDELGRETHFVFDVLDRLVSVTSEDPDAQANGEEPLLTEYTYDAFSNVASVTITNHNEFAQTPVTTTHATCYYYDKMDRIKWVVAPDPAGNTVAATCDDAQAMPTDRSGAEGQWLGRPITFYEEYDKNGNLERVSDPEGRITSFEYDKLDRLNKVEQPAVTSESLFSVPGENVDAGRPVTEFVYDNLGNLWSVTDSLDNTMEYRYDAWNRPIKMILPDPTTGGSTPTETTYDYFEMTFGWVNQITDPEGRKTETQSDFLGRPLYVAAPPDADGVRPITWFEYFDDSQPKIVVDAERNETQYTYDGRARLIQVDQPHSVTTNFAYDGANQLTSVTDPLSRKTDYFYDELGRVTKIEPPDPDAAPGGEEKPTVEYFYDSAGNLLRSTDALSFEMDYEYDHLFRKDKSIDENDDATTYTYDLVNNLQKLIDPEGNETEWTYDALDRPYKEEDSQDNLRQYLYDAVGNLRRSTDAKARVINYDYDNLYRLKKETWGATNRTFEFTYDLVNNLLTATDDAGTANYTFEYDDLDRVVLETQEIAGLSQPIVFAPDYDLIGNRVSQSANFGGSVVDGVLQGGTSDFATSYVYDDLYRLTAITQQGQGGNAVAPKHIAFEYDAASQLTDVTRYSDDAATATKLVAHSLYNYDKVGRITGITHSHSQVSAGWTGTSWEDDPDSDPTQIAAYFFDYDEGNRLTSMKSWRDELTTNYTYDPRDQLTGASFINETGNAPFVPSAAESYAYDDNGNRTSANGQTYTTEPTNHDNELKSDGVHDYEYDEEGNRTKRTVAPNGPYTVYDWDHRNRLIAVTDYTTNPTAVVKKVTYTYDVFDRRIGKEVDTNGDGKADSATYFVYDGPHISLQFEDEDGEGTLTPELSNRYLHGPMIDMILADEQVTEASEEGKVYWPLADHLGSVRDVVDNNGDVQNHVLYDSFGNKLDVGGATNESVDFLFAYTGRDWDEDVDLQYNRARWYDPAVGRWLSEDPIGFEAGDANLYRYVGNTPTSVVDPSGLITPIAVPSHGHGGGMANPSTGQTSNNPNGPRPKPRPPKPRPPTSWPIFAMPPSTPGMAQVIISRRQADDERREDGYGPTFYDQWVWGRTDPNRDITWWFKERYSGHLYQSKMEATEAITAAIRSGYPRRYPNYEVELIHTVTPDYEKANTFTEMFLESPLRDVEDNGEATWGDGRQNPREANASGPGEFWIELDDVEVQWSGDDYTWTATLLIKDSLGVDSEDPVFKRTVSRSLGARWEEEVTWGRIVISGYGSAQD